MKSGAEDRHDPYPLASLKLLGRRLAVADNIYLLREDGSLAPMTEHPYPSEDVLQHLLAKHAELLAGDQIDSVAPRRWLLVSRHVTLPSEEDAGGRWEVDHLFLDQDAIPTLVEVKRSEDTRIRREIVGQLLEYAAHAVMYWPIEMIRARFEARCQREGRVPEAVLADVLGPDGDPEEFWDAVKTNLEAGKLRLIFLADRIPPELRRIVEFLSVQMKSADVFAIEVKQYEGQGLKTLAPRVLGRAPRPSAPAKSWDEAAFLHVLVAKCGASQAHVAHSILEWARARALRLWWGKGRKDGSFFPMLDWNGEQNWTIAVWTYGRVQVQFGFLSQKPPFDSEPKRLELLTRLNGISGVSIPPDSIARYPSFPLSALMGDTALRQFTDALDWVVDEIRAGGTAATSTRSANPGSL